MPDDKADFKTANLECHVNVTGLVLTEIEDKPMVFIEFKFTEEGFSGCSIFPSGDCDGRNMTGDLRLCYLHHIGRRY